MNKRTFHQNLLKATDVVLPFSRELLINSLPSSCLYLVFPNQSYDGNPLEDDEEVYPEETLPEGKWVGPLDDAEAVGRLWRAGKVPEWVNVSVHSYDERHTYLELICCGRFTALDKHLYHRHEGYPPFHVLGPALPPRWESVEESGKFDLYWRGEKPTPAAEQRHAPDRRHDSFHLLGEVRGGG